MNNIATLFRESALARFLIPGGLILAVCGMIFFHISKQQQDYIETESTVTGIELEQEAHTDANGHHADATYTLTVKYTVDGKEYESELFGMGKQDVGDKIKIFYNPADPSQITQSKSLIVPIIMVAVGAAAFAGGIVSVLNTVKKLKKMKEQEKEWANGN